MKLSCKCLRNWSLMSCSGKSSSTTAGSEYSFCPAFDLKSLKLLSRLGFPSEDSLREIIMPLLLKPQPREKIILSTGMSNLGDIETALGYWPLAI